MFNLSRFSILCKQKKHCDTEATFVVSRRLVAHEQRQERETHTQTSDGDRGSDRDDGRGQQTNIWEDDMTGQDGQHRTEQHTTKQNNTNDWN